MAWCHRAASHHLSHCWYWYMSSYEVTRSLWVNSVPVWWCFLSTYWPKQIGCHLKKKKHFQMLCQKAYFFTLIQILFLSVKLTICHHWFMQWLGTEQVTSPYLKQWNTKSQMTICATGPRRVNESLYITFILQGKYLISTAIVLLGKKS